MGLNSQVSISTLDQINRIVDWSLEINLVLELYVAAAGLPTTSSWGESKGEEEKQHEHRDPDEERRRRRRQRWQKKRVPEEDGHHRKQQQHRRHVHRQLPELNGCSVYMWPAPAGHSRRAINIYSMSTELLKS